MDTAIIIPAGAIATTATVTIGTTATTVITTGVTALFTATIAVTIEVLAVLACVGSLPNRGYATASRPLDTGISASTRRAYVSCFPVRTGGGQAAFWRGIAAARLKWTVTISEGQPSLVLIEQLPHAQDVIGPVDQLGSFDHARKARELLLAVLHAAQIADLRRIGGRRNSRPTSASGCRADKASPRSPRCAWRARRPARLRRRRRPGARRPRAASCPHPAGPRRQH